MTHTSAPAQAAGAGAALLGAGGAALVPGELVGRYRVRRLIGEGGMGRVYLARDITLGRSVALKIVRWDRLGAGDVHRVIDEARAYIARARPAKGALRARRSDL